jgi:hypothetical protein
VVTLVREQKMHQYKHWHFLALLAAYRVILLCSVYSVGNRTGMMTEAFSWAVSLLTAGF